MKPARFEYSRPESLDEVLQLLSDFGEEAAVLAGGQSLVPMMNLRLAQPAHLIDLNEVSELAYIRTADGGLAIGALARQRDVERSPDVSRLCPLLVEALRHVGNPQVRNRGTVVGNLAHADPTSELPAVMVACEASIALAGLNGRREIPAADFFLGPFTTGRRADELVIEVRVPALGSRGFAFEEVAPAFTAHPLAAAAAVVEPAGALRVALTGVAGAPVLVTDPDELEPASGDFRRALGAELARRALARAGERARRIG